MSNLQVILWILFVLLAVIFGFGLGTFNERDKENNHDKGNKRNNS